jgi:hypothetical protein
VLSSKKAVFNEGINDNEEFKKEIRIEIRYRKDTVWLVDSIIVKPADIAHYGFVRK